MPFTKNEAKDWLETIAETKSHLERSLKLGGAAGTDEIESAIGLLDDMHDGLMSDFDPKDQRRIEIDVQSRRLKSAVFDRFAAQGIDRDYLDSHLDVVFIG